MRDQLTGVILAAGRGTRMAPFSSKYPKPLLPICNKPLLQGHIEIMKSLGITEIIILIGHLGYEVVKVLGDGERLGVRIKYVEQRDTLGIAHAVCCLEPHISSPFLLFLGDIFFVSENLSPMLEIFRREDVGAVLAVKEENDPAATRRSFGVIADADHFVKQVVEKPRYVPNKLKGCGLYLFDLCIFDAVHRTPRTAMRDEYELTDAIQILIALGVPVKMAPVVQWDINLTYPLDLLHSNLYQLKRLGLANCVEPSSVIHRGAQIVNSVVGESVVLKKPIRVERSLIFPNTVVQTNRAVTNFIMTPENVIDCRYLS